MQILLDTHILLWWLTDSSKLSSKARELIADPANTIIVSAATAWEISIKQTLGKISIEGDLETEVRANGFGSLPIGFSHAAAVRDLPAIHRDPFDRILIAQAQVENLSILTADRHISKYPVTVIQA